MNWRAHLGFLKAEFKNALHFRANLYAWILFTPLKLTVVLLIWHLIYQTTDRVGGMGYQDMIQYYLIVQILISVFGSVLVVNYKVWQDINTGRLDTYLARPVYFGLATYFRALGAPLTEWILAIPFLFIASWLLALPMPTDPWVILAFWVSATTGFTLLFLIQFLIGSLTFWVEGIFGIRDIIFSVFLLFSGELLPMEVLPTSLQRISHFLPFEAIYYLPAKIYGTTSMNADITQALLRQGVWLLALGCLAVFTWNKGMKRYASQGG